MKINRFVPFVHDCCIDYTLCFVLSTVRTALSMGRVA